MKCLFNSAISLLRTAGTFTFASTTSLFVIFRETNQASRWTQLLLNLVWDIALQVPSLGPTYVCESHITAYGVVKLGLVLFCCLEEELLVADRCGNSRSKISKIPRRSLMSRFEIHPRFCCWTFIWKLSTFANSVLDYPPRRRPRDF
jgi:hypothetical protein